MSETDDSNENSTSSETDETAMTLRVAISMQKGGVGKTTTSINLAGALAARGHDVLAIDADPQGALSVKLGLREDYLNGDRALYDALLDHGDLELDDLDQLVTSHTEFDVIPAHIRDFRLEQELYTATRSEERLRTALERSPLEYDFVVIDSPPNLGPLADGAIIAAEHVLFPSHANEISQHNLNLLFDEIETLEDVFDDYSVAFVGGVLNQFEEDTVSSATRDWFTDTFGEENVFEIPRWKAIEHAIGYRTSVFGYDAEDAGYPWDEDKVESLRNRYDLLADHVEGYQ